MPLEPKAQLVDPQGPLDVDGVNATGITTATGGFVGQVQGSATGLAATTLNITAGIITATRFIGDVTGTASSLAQGANITVGIMTATFVGDLIGNATGLSTTTSNLNLGIVTSTGFRGNFTGLSSGLSGTPNIQTGIVTATKFLGNSTGAVVDLADDTNINVGIITATKFEGNTTGSVTDLADDTNINVGIITASKFIGNANGSVVGLADDTNINVATFTGTQFIGNSPGTAADLKSGTNLTVGTFTGTKFIGNTPGSATKLADDVNVAAGTFTGTKFVGNTPGTVSGIADDTNLNLGTLTGTKFIGNATGSVSAISDDTNLNLGTLTGSKFIGNATGSVSAIADDTNLNLGTLTASQFIGNTPGNAAGISAGKNITGGTITATTFHGDGSGLTGIGVTGFIRQDITASSGGTINLNNGNAVYLTHDANVTLSFSNVPPSTRVVIARTLTNNTISWPAAVKWDGGSAPTLLGLNSFNLAGQVFALNTYDGGTNWYGWEVVDNNTIGGPYQLWGWGDNEKGGIGDNSNVNRSSPVQVPGTTWVSVNNNSSFDDGDFSVGIKNDGTLWVWGDNEYGQLGQNQAEAQRGAISSPVQVPGTTWSQAARGGEFVIATKTDGTAWSWGSNQNGALGQNQSTAISSPTQIPGTTWSTTEDKIAAARYGFAAVKTDGTLWITGDNEYGLGDNTAYSTAGSRSSPIQVPGTNWAHVGTQGNRTQSATKTDGTLWLWGQNNSGQLGQGNKTNYSSPVQVPGTTWSRVRSGTRTSLAVKSDGTMWAWGDNEYGQLGQNNQTDYESPVQIPGTTWSTNLTSIVEGNSTLAIKTDNTMWAWGQNQRGDLAQNNTIKRSSPVQIPGATWFDVGGGQFSVALKQS
tara:strand:+ start:961 stop:3570 length:2610 start_codon:yes stop_codon:yes gene_type:complete